MYIPMADLKKGDLTPPPPLQQSKMSNFHILRPQKKKKKYPLSPPPPPPPRLFSGRLSRCDFSGRFINVKTPPLKKSCVYAPGRDTINCKDTIVLCNGVLDLTKHYLPYALFMLN